MSNLIRNLRIELNITQNKLAKIVGVNQSTISRLEQNAMSSNFKLIFKILLFFQCEQKQKRSILHKIINANHLEFMIKILDDENVRKLIARNPNFAAKMVIKNVFAFYL